MDYKNLIYEKKKWVGKIVINRPKALNAIDLESMVELKNLLLEIKDDPQIRVILITGSGDKSFIVGADRNEMKRHGDDEKEAKEFEVCGRDAFSLLENMGKPSICAINGFAFGLGLQLALASTFRIVSAEARLGLPEINFGFFPSMGATQRLTRLVGEGKAMEMILTGEPIDGEEAFRIGLANKLIPSAELKEYAEKFAEKLSEKSPITMNLAMDAIKHEKILSMEDGLAYESELSDICFKTEDFQEGRSALSEKRKPIFKGR
ncbi:MAG: enoyl-CoA hydratase-related protein [Candidatus Zixiibacteriota bacterium]